ncbi:MAG: hypothetical protein AAFO58_09575 [Pseudomonadota bacterium]
MNWKHVCALLGLITLAACETPEVAVAPDQPIPSTGTVCFADLIDNDPYALRVMLAGPDATGTYDWRDDADVARSGTFVGNVFTDSRVRGTYTEASGAEAPMKIFIGDQAAFIEADTDFLEMAKFLQRTACPAVPAA